MLISTSAIDLQQLSEQCSKADHNEPLPVPDNSDCSDKLEAGIKVETDDTKEEDKSETQCKHQQQPPASNLTESREMAIKSESSEQNAVKLEVRFFEQRASVDHFSLHCHL